MVGGLSLLFLYLLLLFRIFMSVYKTEHFFGQLLIVGVGLPIIMQSLVNMGVAVSIFPVTGQPLPLISSGGTSIWMTFLALGIVQSVTAGRMAESDEKNPLAILSEAV
jgi:cell division protein FtsW